MIVTTKGSVDVAAPREAVWAALHDVERCALCVPGCRSVSRESDNAYRVTAAVRFGPVRVAFDGMVEVDGFEALQRLSLIGRGRGGPAGTASGTAMIRLAERPGGCRLSYELEARTDGPIARLGPTFLTGLAGALSATFARRFARLFEPRAPARQASRWRPRPPGKPSIFG